MSQEQRSEGHPKPEQKYRLTIVVQGQPYTDEFNINMPLGAISEKALEKTHNSGPLSKWKLTTQSGAVLSFDVKLKDSGVQDGATLFLSLREGGGGARG
jgi:hypothetical protein